MPEKYLKVIILAAVADGEIQDEEMNMLRYIQTSHPRINQIPEEVAQAALANIYNQLNAGMETKHILDQIGREFTEDEKNTAYALAKEICASDFSLLPAEEDFIKLIETEWAISTEVIEVVEKSIQLRYFT